jgi:RHS repeat-associated protein
MNTCPQTYKFSGKERDTETDNDEFGARYYSSSLGRFTIGDWSAVPVAVPYADLTNPQTLNLYAYVKNNPLRYTDPTGHAGGGPAEGPTGAMFYMIGGGEPGNAVTGYTVSVNGEETSFLDSDEANAFYNQAVKQAQNRTPFNPTITYDKNFSKKDLAATKKNVEGAVGIINSRAVWSSKIEVQVSKK